MKKPTWRNFKDTRKFVQSLGLKSNKEWREFCKSDEKPDDIPVKPQDRYRNKGWLDWGDFLGTGTVSPQNKKHRIFEDARKYVQLEKILTQKKWKEYCKSNKKPKDIPSNPNLVYKNKGWNGYPDWLGTNYVPNQERKYKSFSNARTFARNLELDSRTDWNNYCKSGDKPDDIHTNPDKFYKNKGWNGMGDFLGTGTVANQDREFLSFEKARKIICEQDPKINSKDEWADFCKSGKRPTDIPYSPDRTYKNKGWNGWPDWLGTGTIANRNRVYLSFEDARGFVRLLKLKNEHEWRKHYASGQLPNNIPTAPAVYYKKEWKGFGDWLGTGTIANRNKIFLSAKEAKPVLKKLFKEYGIKNKKDWLRFAKTHGKLLEKLHLPYDLLRTYSLKNAESNFKI